jgi:exopolyphosphatase/guanosine-5'-triphosphate,3'-diphosphate pyrophosphatase
MTVAAVDIGSNTVRLLITADDGAEVAREVVVTGLGRGVDAAKVLERSAVDATLEVISRYAELCRRSGVGRIGAVATSATRDARNGAAVMDEIAELLGVVPEVIAGDREALLSYAGATDGLDSGPHVVCDIGGGSTEFIEGEAGSVSWSHSYDIGSVRLTDRCLGGHPPSPDRVARARAEVDAVLSEPRVRARTDTLIGVAGTFTSLAGIHLGLDRYDRAAVHGTMMTTDDIATLGDALAIMTLRELEAIPSLDPARAPVIVAGAIIAQRALLAASAEEVRVSEHDLLDGLTAELRSQPRG